MNAEVSAAKSEVISKIFAADKAMDADRFALVLAEQATMRIGAGPPIIGRPAIRQAVADLFAGFDSISHQLVTAYEQGPRLIYDAEVTYGLGDGRSLVLPYVNILRFEDELIVDYRIYIDLSPLHGSLLA